MSAFKDLVAADNRNVFLNMDEFGEEHDLNGTKCRRRDITDIFAEVYRTEPEGSDGR